MAYIEKLAGFEGSFGYTNVVTMLVEGCRVVWLTATAPGVSVGELKKVAFTVKEHAPYKGEKQTKVTRVSFK